MNDDLRQRTRLPYFLYGIILVVLVPQWFMAIKLAPDSLSYIQMWSNRPPLLPILLRLDQFFFNQHFYLFHTIQIGLMAYALIVVDRWIRRRFPVPHWVVAVALLLFLLPTYIFFGGGRYILSEALSFPLFVLLLTHFFDFFLDRRLKSAVYFSVLSALLILTRDQFYFLYGIMAVSIFWLLFYKEKKQKIFKIAMIFLATAVLVGLVSRTYQYIINQHFRTTTSKSVLLLVQPLFFSNVKDANRFKDKRIRKAFLDIYEATHKAGFLLDSQPTLNLNRHAILPVYARFFHYFDPIQAEIFDVLRQGGRNEDEVNHISDIITLGLLKQHWQENLKFYSWKLIYSLGGFYFSLLWMLVAIIASVRLLVNKNDPIAMLIGATFLMSVANNTTIAVSQMMLYRYLAYSFFAFLILFSIILSTLFLRNRNDPGY
jgi:hypothetical protein